MSRNLSRQHMMLALVLLVTLAGIAQAVPPQSISYQAYLKDSAGLPVNTTQSITFRIYDVASGGTPLWSDTLSVSITDGLFSVELGTGGNPLPKAAFGNALWLGVEIGTDGEAVPRNALNAMGNAFRSEDSDTVGGITAIDLDQSADVATNTTNITSHTANTGNPHNVTAAQVGALTTADITTHEGNASAHHAKTTSFADLTTGQVASGQIANGAVTDAKITGPIAGSKIDSTGLDAATVGGQSAASLNQSAHVADTTTNPHNVTAVQTGAATPTDISNHAGDADVHHSKTNSFSELNDSASDGQIPVTIARDTEIFPTVLAADGSGSGLDADKLDGLSSSAFMAAGTDIWVNNTGDAMSGNLTTTGNIGVGITSPNTKLHVIGNESNNYLGFFSNDTLSNSAYGIYSKGDAYDAGTTAIGMGAYLYGKGGSTAGSAYGSQHFAYAYGSSTAYGVYSNAEGGTTAGPEYAFYGLGEGYFSQNLGIGTDSPTHKLEVVGSKTDYVGHFINNISTNNAKGIYSEANAYGSTNKIATGAYLKGVGGYSNSTAYGSRHEASAYGSGKAYGVYSDATLGNTIDREYAFYGKGDGYFSQQLAIGSTLIPNGTEVLINGIGSTGSNADLFMRERGSTWGFNFGASGGTDPSNAKLYISESDGSTFSDILILTSNLLPRVGIGRTPTFNALEVQGNSSQSTSTLWLLNSDATIKTEVEPLRNALATIEQVRPVRFRYTPDYLAAHPEVEDKEYYNVIAQEYAEVFPEAVNESGELIPSGEREILQVDLHPALITTIAAIKELKAENVALRKELAEIRTMLKNR